MVLLDTLNDNVKYGVLSGFHGADPHAWRIFSFDNDPDIALHEARQTKRGCRLSYATCIEGRRIVDTR